MAVSTTFSFDPQEHYRALRVVTRYTPARWLGWAFGIGLPVLAISVFILPRWDEATPSQIFASALPWLIIGAFWLALLPWVQRRAARTLAKRDVSVQGPQERSVDSAGFHSVGNGVRLDVPWHAMSRAVETDQFFLFFYNKQCAYYLPKRVLAADQVIEVRTLARQALGERIQLLDT